MEAGTTRNVVILGSGPAGLTAAVYTREPTSNLSSSRESPRRQATSRVGSSC